MYKATYEKKGFSKHKEKENNIFLWVLTQDAGSASKTIWYHSIYLDSVKSKAQLRCTEPFGIPYSIDSFTKCLNLLKEFPDLNDSFQRITNNFKEWVPFLEQWSNLELLYNSKTFDDIEYLKSALLKLKFESVDYQTTAYKLVGKKFEA